jgi:hypothetical protein
MSSKDWKWLYVALNDNLNLALEKDESSDALIKSLFPVDLMNTSFQILYTLNESTLLKDLVRKLFQLQRTKFLFVADPTYDESWFRMELVAYPVKNLKFFSL